MNWRHFAVVAIVSSAMLFVSPVLAGKQEPFDDVWEVNRSTYPGFSSLDKGNNGKDTYSSFFDFEHEFPLIVAPAGEEQTGTLLAQGVLDAVGATIARAMSFSSRDDMSYFYPDGDRTWFSAFGIENHEFMAEDGWLHRDARTQFMYNAIAITPPMAVAIKWDALKICRNLFN